MAFALLDNIIREGRWGSPQRGMMSSTGGLYCGRYLDVVEIGAGAFGTVYQAFDTRRGLYVALKESACGRSSSSLERIARMRQEYNLLNRLEHSNIVTVYDFHEMDDGFVVISMEFASGGSLLDVMQKTKFRFHESTVRQYFRDALKGITYLHQNGVLHCDIKPGNLLLSGRLIKVCDFGLSKQTSNDNLCHTTSQVYGTPRYMAPELWRDNRYSAASDLWALACTVVELASGRLPFEDTLPRDTHFYAIVFFLDDVRSRERTDAVQAIIPRHLSSTLQSILRSMLEVVPQKRPSAATLLSHAYFDGNDIEGVEPEANYDKEILRAHSTSSFSSSEWANSGEEPQSTGLSVGSPSTKMINLSDDEVSVVRSEEHEQQRGGAPSAFDSPNEKAPKAKAKLDNVVSKKSVVTSKLPSSRAVPSSSNAPPVALSLAKASPPPSPVTVSSTISSMVAKGVEKVMRRKVAPKQQLSSNDDVNDDSESPSHSVKHHMPVAAKVTWIFVNGRQKVPFAEALQAGIELAYQQQGQKGKYVCNCVRLFDGVAQDYEIDFEKMRQKNMSTSYMRKIERLVE